MRKDHDEKEVISQSGMSRRGFIGSVGAGVIGAAVTTELQAEPTAHVNEASELSKVALRVNGREHTVYIEPRVNLIHVLRDHLGLTGTKPGCDRGECGACTVLFDGVPRYSCLTLALEAEGHEITTVEGVMKGEELGLVQQAFAHEDAFQCGYCTPGQIMAAEGLLRKNVNPTIEEIREGMSGNLCRCGAYGHIFRAVRKASELRSKDS